MAMALHQQQQQQITLTTWRRNIKDAQCNAQDIVKKKTRTAAAAADRTGFVSE